MININNYEIMNGSIIQSSFNLINTILQEYQVLQPDFKYDLYYGTNFDFDYSFDNDKFSIVMMTGGIEKIPSHFVELEGRQQLLYAGYFDIMLSIVNPISTRYSDELEIISSYDSQITESSYVQTEQNTNINSLPEEEANKIDKGTRLLEGLSIFLTRKNLNIDNFKFTTIADSPIIEGQYEVGIYRLLTAVGITTKFSLQNTLGKSLVSGEDSRLWFKFLGSDGEYTNDWEEYYGQLVISFENTLSNKQYPVSGIATLQQLSNQIIRTMEISSPDLDLGANITINGLIDSGNLTEMTKLKIKYYNGKVTKYAQAIFMNKSQSLEINRFGSISLLLGLTSDLKDSEVI